MNAVLDTVEINGTKYVRQDSVKETPVLTGKRAVVVVDRGWIFAGDVREENGRIYLDRPVWVFSWDSIGLDGVIKDPRSNRVTLKKLDNFVDIPCDSEIFRIPVCDNWGL